MYGVQSGTPSCVYLEGVIHSCYVWVCSGPLPSNVSGANANGTNFFPALRAMNISHNAFTGSLPASFGQSGVFNLKPLQVPLLLPAPGRTR